MISRLPRLLQSRKHLTPSWRPIRTIAPSLDLEIITCANDSRITDLDLLLRSVRRYLPNAPLSIIPFSDSILEVTKLAKTYGAEIAEPDPFWDELGRAFYKNEQYRPGLPRWTYFRKLNMFNSPLRPRLYLDANCLLLSSSPLGKIILGRDADVIFHSGAAAERNWSLQVAEHMATLSPRLRYGFNLGHCGFTPDAARMIRNFAEIVSPRSRSILSYSPEQAFLCLALSYLKLNTCLMSDIDPMIAGGNSAGSGLAEDADGNWRFTEGPHRGRIVTSVKKAAVAHLSSKGYDAAAEVVCGFSAKKQTWPA